MGNHRSIDDAVTVVIRSVGERTENLCRELVAAQIAHRNIFLVREKPFACAVQRTFQIGIDQGRPWTLAVDADTLLLPGVIQRLYACAENQDANLFKAQGLVIDKFLSSPRAAGNHFYRTAHLNRALNYIPGQRRKHQAGNIYFKKYDTARLYGYADRFGFRFSRF